MNYLDKLFIASTHSYKSLEDVEMFKKCDTLILIRDNELAKVGNNKGFIEFTHASEMEQASTQILKYIEYNGFEKLLSKNAEINDMKATAFKLKNGIVLVLVSKLVFDETIYDKFLEVMEQDAENNKDYIQKMKELKEINAPFEEYDLIELPVYDDEEEMKMAIEGSVENIIKANMIEIQTRKLEYPTGQSGYNHLIMVDDEEESAGEA